MIRLVKGQPPEILVENEAQWAQDYLELRMAGGHNDAIESRHRHPDIKAALIAETSDKCMYCEMKISLGQFGDVEHILPKDVHPELYIDWQNLGLACIKCNNAKSNHVGFVNPFAENPCDHLSFAGPLLRYDPHDPKGRLTVKGLRLNRWALLERRAAALEKLQEKLDLLAGAPPGAIRDALEAELQEATANDQEYAGALQAFMAA